MHRFTMFSTAVSVILLLKLRYFKNKKQTYHWLEANLLYARAIVQKENKEDNEKIQFILHPINVDSLQW